ncbi:MAG: protein kinase [Planctomycetes bacterium]|nr:protein kinase [Planctomycetota bacterium]
MAKASALSVGTRIGPYEILAPIGAGGMGEVFRARDTRLDRDVAVKVLPERLHRDPDSLARFEREAKAIAALSHPNILTIHDYGTHNRVSYLVMDLLEGETLRERLHRSAIPWRKTVEIGIGIADGLSAAHEKGIIHRDLKPENLFLESSGVVRILDFGLARSEQTATRTDRTVTLDTRPGTVMGTVNYMSPEQVRGEPLDARTDIFSFGCVLYEMVTGGKAFSAETSPETLTAVLNYHPPEPGETGATTCPEFDQLINRCLEKKPPQRFHSSNDLAFTLRNILHGSGPTKVLQGQGAGYVRTLAIVLSIAVALMIGGFAYLLTRRDSPVPRTTAITSLAVLPLENRSADPNQEYFTDGMTEELITALGKIGALRVISPSSIWKYKGTGKTLSEISRELNAIDAFVTGSVAQIGSRVRITARLVQVSGERMLWTESYERDVKDVFALQAEVARAVAEQIGITLTPQEDYRLAVTDTVRPDAFDAYLEGRHYLRRGTVESSQVAVERFEKAIQLDPEFATAHAAQSDAYRSLSTYFLPPKEVMPKARKAAQKALELDDTLAEAHTSLAYVKLNFDWDWEAAERGFKRALALEPGLPEAHLGYARYLLVMGRIDEAEAHLNSAREYDPASVLFFEEYGLVYFMSRQYDKTIQYARRAIQIDPEQWTPHSFLGLALGAKGEFTEATTELRTALRLNENPANLAELGGVYAAADMQKEARQILRDLDELSKTQYVCPYRTGIIHIELGEYDKAFEQFQKACDDRSDCMPFVKADPRFDPIRDDPRFDDLVECVGLEPDGRILTADPATPDEIVLAVLPFEDSSPEPQEWFSNGMTVELIATLGKIKALKVISRTSVMRYKNAPRPPLRTIARELNANRLIEGSVLRIGGRVRITVELIDGLTDTSLWSKSYERDARDVLALQSEVARAIADEIRIIVTPAEHALLAKASPVNPDAYDAYMKGIDAVRRGTFEDCLTAIRFFDMAVEIDSEMALAHAGRAEAYRSLSGFHLPPKETQPRAKAAALRALALDENLAEAHTALGQYKLEYEWDWTGAEASFRRALEIDHNSTDARLGLAQYYTAMKRADDAMAQMDIVRELDPAARHSYPFYGLVTFMTRRFERTIRESREALAVNEQFWPAHMWLGMALAEMDDHATAIYHLERAYEINDETTLIAAALGAVLANAGRREEAEALLAELKASEDRNYVCPYELATISIGLGDHDEAFAEMHRACDGRAVCMPWLQVDPRLDPLRPDPRFDDVLTCVGFTPPPRGLKTTEEP